MRSTASPQNCNNKKSDQDKSFCVTWTNLGLCRQQPSLLFSWSVCSVSAETCLGCSFPLYRSFQEPICEKRGNYSATLWNKRKKKKGSQKGWWGRRMKADDAANHQHCFSYTHCALDAQSLPLLQATVRKASLCRPRAKNKKPNRYRSIQLTSEHEASTDHTYHQHLAAPALQWMAHRTVGRASAVCTSWKRVSAVAVCGRQSTLQEESHVKVLLPAPLIA